MRCGRLALARGHSGEPQDREDPGLLFRFLPQIRPLFRGWGANPRKVFRGMHRDIVAGTFRMHASPSIFARLQKSTVVIWPKLVPIGDGGLRDGWRSRGLRALGPRRAGVGLHPELQNRVRLLPEAQPQTYLGVKHAMKFNVRAMNPSGWARTYKHRESIYAHKNT